MTAFSDLPAPPEHPLHPSAEQIHAYLRAYAERFGIPERIRYASPVERVARLERGEAGWEVDGEPFDGVVVASGRFRKPRLAPGLDGFAGELLHAFDYAGAGAFEGRRTLVYGNGISGLEIASDVALSTEVVSAFRKPRYVIQKVVGGVSSDWQWYTAYGAIERRKLDRDELSLTMRERVVAVAGNPADFGAPEPDPDFLVAGISLCQDYLAQVANGSIRCRPGIAAVEGSQVRFTDGSRESVDAIVCATGYELDIPYLDERIRTLLGPELRLFHRTLHPDLPGLGVIGQFLAQGPYFPLLELQARWIVALWAGDIEAPEEQAMRVGTVDPPPVDPHNALAMTLSEQLGVAPDPLDHPDLADPLMFGPLLPPRYRLIGPGAQPNAADRFTEQLAASPRTPADPAQLDSLDRFGLSEVAELVREARG